MAKADSGGKVGKPDQMYADQLCKTRDQSVASKTNSAQSMFWGKDQLWKSLDQSVRWLGTCRMSATTVGSLQIVAELANEAGWKTDEGKPFIVLNDRKEVAVYNLRNREWIRFPQRGYVAVSIVKQVREALAALLDKRADELTKSALPTKPKRGPKAEYPKDDAIKIHESVVALAKAEDISFSTAAQRLSETLGFPPSNWLKIYKAATRKDR